MGALEAVLGAFAMMVVCIAMLFCGLKMALPGLPMSLVMTILRQIGHMSIHCLVTPLRILKGFLALREATLDSIECPKCGREVSLVGQFECSCGFQREGRFFAKCPSCGRQESFIRCSCGTTILRPYYTLTGRWHDKGRK